MKGGPDVLWGVVFLAFVGLAGCLPYTRATASREARFAPLYERDLSEFERAMAVENDLEVDDAWTRVGEAWLALANCRPVDREVEFGDDGEAATAGFVHAALVLEDTRRRLTVASRLAGGEGMSTPRLVERIREPDFFDREPPARSEDTVRWPAEDEDWADEVPAAVVVESDCEKLAAQIQKGAGPFGGESEERGGEKEADDSEMPLGRVDQWRAAMLEAVERVVTRYERLDGEMRRGSLAATYWRSRVYGAVRADRYAEIYTEEGPSEGSQPSGVVERLRADNLDERANRWLARLVEGDSSAEEYLDASTRARISLVAAERAAEAGEPERVVASVDRALELGLEPTNRWMAKYLRLRALTRVGRWKEAVATGDELPPEDSPYFAPYAYRLGVALRQLDGDERLLGMAKEVFRVRQPPDNPFLRGLYEKLVRLMARYEFEARVVEVLEEVGPRSGTYRRVEEFARVCLSRGRLDNAEAAGRWLLDHRQDARFRPRYRGILAMVGFYRNDTGAFRRQIEELIDRPESLLEVIPPHRRAEFFAPADSALADVFRRMLPAMAEWGDSEVAQARRRRWLEVIVDETQAFLRETDESMVRSRLVEMYRMASSLLEDDPRGYAERVGSEESAPLVLGTVEVGPGRLEPHEPALRVRILEPYSLAVIPRDDGAAPEWPRRWPDDNEGSDDA